MAERVVWTMEHNYEAWSVVDVQQKQFISPLVWLEDPELPGLWYHKWLTPMMYRFWISDPNVAFSFKMAFG